MDRDPATDDSVQDCIFSDQLFLIKYRNCFREQMPASDHSNGFISRELSSIIKKPYARVKITFDVLCLATTGLLTGLMLGYLDGLGIGTIVAAFTMGKMVSITGSWIDQRVTFVSALSKQTI